MLSDPRKKRAIRDIFPEESVSAIKEQVRAASLALGAGGEKRVVYVWGAGRSSLLLPATKAGRFRPWPSLVSRIKLQASREESSWVGGGEPGDRVNSVEEGDPSFWE